MIVLCCVVLYDFVHCLLLRRNNKYNEFPIIMATLFVSLGAIGLLYDWAQCWVQNGTRDYALAQFEHCVRDTFYVGLSKMKRGQLLEHFVPFYPVRLSHNLVLIVTVLKNK